MSDQILYLLHTETGDLGPVDRKSIIQMLINNEISDLTPCRKSSDEDWSVVSEFIQVAISENTKASTMTSKTVKIELPNQVREEIEKNRAA